MDGSSFCSPPKVRRSVCLTGNLEVVESSVIPVFPNDSSEASDSGLIEKSGEVNRSLSSNAVAQTSVSLEGVLVDQAVDTLLSLPEVVGQVSAIQKDHHQEIQRQLVQLHKLQADIKQSKEKGSSVMQEMSSVDRKTRMIEEEVLKREKLCQAYQNEIESLITVCEELRHKLRARQDEFKAENSKYGLYISKIEAHKIQVKEFESTLPAQQKLLNLQQRISNLKAQKEKLSENVEEFTAICSGEREVEIIRDIDEMKMGINTLNAQILHKQKQLSSIKNQENKIQLAISVLHKRNAAQLTRLKRQVKEQHLRHRQWQDQQSQLQHSIAETKTKLEE